MHPFFEKGSGQQECEISGQFHGFSFLLKRRCCQHFEVEDCSLALLSTPLTVTAIHCPFSVQWCCLTQLRALIALEASGLPTFSNLLHAITIITTLWVGWQFFLYRFATVGARWAEYWQKKPAIGFPLNSARHFCMPFKNSKAGIGRAPAIVPAALSARRRSTTTILSWFLGNATKIPGAFQKTFMCHWNNTSACKKYTKTSDFKSTWEQNPPQLVE